MQMVVWPKSLLDQDGNDGLTHMLLNSSAVVSMPIVCRLKETDILIPKRRHSSCSALTQVENQTLTMPLKEI
jgi:hypothetical protein